MTFNKVKGKLVALMVTEKKSRVRLLQVEVGMGYIDDTKYGGFRKVWRLK